MQPLARDTSPSADLARAANARSDFNIGYCGYRFNGDIGAYTVRFRHYDPTPGMCRWLERDPAGYQDGPSLYSYLGRNPMAGTDPYGLARLYSVRGGSSTAEAIKSQLEQIDRNKDGARLCNGSKYRNPLGSDADFRAAMRINSDRREDVVRLAQGLGTAIETTASVLPGGDLATAANEFSRDNIGSAVLNVLPAEKVAGLCVSILLSRTFLVKFASAERAAAGGGRGLNRLLPDASAVGAHSVFKRDAEGKITNYATYEQNLMNPSGFQEVRRVVVTGRTHRNPDGTAVPTPHVKEAGKKGVRPALPEEIP